MGIEPGSPGQKSYTLTWIDFTTTIQILHSLKRRYCNMTEKKYFKNKKNWKMNEFCFFRWRPEVTTDFRMCEGHCDWRITIITEIVNVLFDTLKKNPDQTKTKNLWYIYLRTGSEDQNIDRQFFKSLIRIERRVFRTRVRKTFLSKNFNRHTMACIFILDKKRYHCD